MNFNRKINLKTIMDLSNNGLSDIEICRELNITMDEFNFAINEQHEINDAIEYLY